MFADYFKLMVVQFMRHTRVVVYYFNKSLLETRHVGTLLESLAYSGNAITTKPSEKAPLIISKGRGERREVCRCSVDARAPSTSAFRYGPPAVISTLWKDNTPTPHIKHLISNYYSSESPISTLTNRIMII